jgi:hypothetical protein
MSEWLTGVVGALSAIAGGLVTGAYDSFRDWVMRPKLVLDFDGEGRGFIPLSERRVDGALIEEKWLRIKLTNDGRRVARECQVYLVNVEELHEGHRRTTSYTDARPLFWPGYPRECGPRALPPSVSFFADVASVQKTIPGWNFHIKGGLYQSEKIIGGYTGTYRLTMLATADNAKPVSAEVDVRYEHQWDTFRAFTAPR